MKSRRPSRLLIASLAATAAVVVGGVALSDPPAEPAPTPSKPADVSPRDFRAAAVVPRDRLCEAIPDAAITTALGGDAVAKEYLPAASVQYIPGHTDLVAEFGCSFRRVSSVARVWVFEAPVEAREARALSRSPLPGTCRTLTAYNYGQVGRTTLCRTKPFKTFAARGLFGDAWLSCQLQWPEPVRAVELRARSQQWCNEVLYSVAEPAPGER